MQFDIERELTEKMLFGLAAIGAYGETGVWRPAYSEKWVYAQDQVAEWCREAGLHVYRDAAGNVWGRLQGSDDTRVIVTGSHIDTQLPGGRYDGALGVVAGLVALKTLKDQFGTPTRTLEVVSFCQEESSRFPSAQMWGSRAVTGDIPAAELADEVIGYDGISIGDAMRDCGLEPEKLLEAVRTDIDVFVELHIEQGPVLEEKGLSVAVVQRINGSRTYRVNVRGRSDHAGARPMDLRLDPMAGAAEMISGIIDTAHRMGRPAVTTVGRIQAEPNLSSIVPESVMFTINARHSNKDQGEILYSRLESLMHESAERRGLEVNWEVVARREPKPFDSELVQLFQQVTDDCGIPSIVMDSAGGHDAGRMADIARTVMLFVQSEGGRSHTPKEFTAIEHVLAGIRTLTAGLRRLAY